MIKKPKADSTDEEKETYRLQRNARANRYYKNRTPEQILRDREANRRAKARRTAEQIARDNAVSKNYVLSPEQKKQYARTASDKRRALNGDDERLAEYEKDDTLILQSGKKSEKDKDEWRKSFDISAC